MYALILGVKGLKYVFMVDKKTRSTTPTLSMVLREGMTPQLETGIRHFVLECGPSYTIASRRYSIWSLLSRHIDSPVSEAFKRLGTPHLFEGSFSKWLRDSNMAAKRLFFKSLYRSNETNSELTANIESLVDLSYFILARHPSKKYQFLARGVHLSSTIEEMLTTAITRTASYVGNSVKLQNATLNIQKRTMRLKGFAPTMIRAYPIRNTEMIIVSEIASLKNLGN